MQEVSLHKRLTYREHQALPDSAFACPSERTFPVQDARHARDALARWDNPRTTLKAKCIGGRERICKAMVRFGVEPRKCYV